MLGDFTARMRAQAPGGWMTLAELCEHAGVDSGVLFYNAHFGSAMQRMTELGVLSQEMHTVADPDSWQTDMEYVKVLHPNLWEEVVGTLKHAETLCRLHKPGVDDVVEIHSVDQYVKTFGKSEPTTRDFAASGQVSTKRLT